MKYIIPQIEIDWSKNRFYHKGGVDVGRKWRKTEQVHVGEYEWFDYPVRDGYIGLWDRNSEKMAWFRIIDKCVDKLAYIVERGGVPSYWRKIILPA